VIAFLTAHILLLAVIAIASVAEVLIQVTH